MCYCFILSLLNLYPRNYSLCACNHFLRHSNPMPRESVIELFPRSPLWDEIQELEKSLPSTDHISKNIAIQALKFFDEFSQDFSFAPYECQILNLRRKNFIAQMPRWPVYELEKIPNFHRWYLLKYCEPRSEIFRQPSSRFQLRTLEISASEAS